MNYRLFTFINFYLSGIQQGIQTAHIVHELFDKYPNRGDIAFEDDTVLYNWAKNHKTIIVLNGGAEPQLAEIETAINAMHMHRSYPFASFYEDEGLGYIRTGIGIILPQSMYDAQYNQDRDEFEWSPSSEGRSSFYHAGSSQYAFLKLLKSKRLAA